MLSKRKLKRRAQTRLFRAAMITPLLVKRAQAKTGYDSVQQRLLSSKHIDDGGKTYRAFLGMNNHYADEYNRLTCIIERRLHQQPKHEQY